MIRRKLIFATGLLSFLVGCGTPVSRNTTPAALAEKAVIIVSVSHDVEFRAGANAIVYMDAESMTTQVLLKSVQEGLVVPVASDFSDRRGHLYVLEVNPGPHRFNGWQVVSGGVRIFRKEPVDDLTFDVKKGDVLYLGNIHSRLEDGHWVLGGRSARSGVPVVVDRSDQDIPLAEAKIPALAGKVQSAVLPVGLWARSLSNDARSVAPIVVPPPIRN